MTKLKIKSGDTVKVVAGDHKGSEGKVLTVLIEKNKAIVEGVNMVKKHTKPNAQNPQGGIIEKEAPIHISNVALYDTEAQSRFKVGFRVDSEGNKVRYNKTTGNSIDS